MTYQGLGFPVHKHLVSTMSKHLQRDLGILHRDLLAMAAAVETAIQKAVHALDERDASLAEEVVAGDAIIDREEIRIEEECLKFLALHQPVAVDLRRVAAAMKINTELERMADLAEGIAKRARRLASVPDLPSPPPLARMTELTLTMVRQSLEAFVNLDAPLARQVWLLDDEVDRYNKEIITELVKIMQQAPASVRPVLWLFSAVRSLERIADHATNIAEDVLYLVGGEIVRHTPSLRNTEGS